MWNGPMQQFAPRKATEATAREDDASPPKPSYKFRHDALPPAFGHLIARPWWVAWEYVLKEGRWTKLPFSPHGGRIASVSNPKTWGTFAQALAVQRKRGLAGVGLVLTKEASIIGIDLDDCVTDAGSLTPIAARVLSLGETYAEYSPSGCGIRLFASGTLSAAIKNKALGIEVYSTGRYLTVTGDAIEEVS
jgi:primase-polymerase (primpol)-like protein